MNVQVESSVDVHFGQVMSLPRAAICIYISALIVMMACSVVTVGVAEVPGVVFSTDFLSYCCW